MNRPRRARRPDRQARAELVERFGEDAAAAWYYEGAYFGPRAGFSADGSWRFFIPAGD